METRGRNEDDSVGAHGPEPLSKRRRICADSASPTVWPRGNGTEVALGREFASRLSDPHNNIRTLDDGDAPSHIDRLPDELLALVLAHLPCLMRLAAARVCRRWCVVAKDRAASPHGLCAPAQDTSPCVSAAAMLHGDCVDHALSLGWSLSGDECRIAAHYGRVGLFERFYDAGCARGPMWSATSVAIAAARQGHVSVLHAMAERGIGIHWRPVLREAAGRGQLGCLVYARANGHPFDRDICQAAAAAGHLDCLRYLHEHGCMWDSGVTAAAAAGGHLDCLRYLHEQACPWDKSATEAAVGGADLDDPYARREGHVDCLRYLYEQGCPWDGGVCEIATRRGAIACLTYALDAGCACEDMDAAAIVCGSLEAAAVLQAHGYRWTSSAMREAAHFGAWDLVDVLHEYGCPWDEDVCTFAAARGDIVQIERARARGCPWDMGRCVNAAIRADQVDAVRWLCDPPNDCPLHAHHFTMALESRCGTALLDLVRRRVPQCNPRETTMIAAAWSDCVVLYYLLHERMIEAAPSLSASRLQTIAARAGRLDLVQLLDAQGHHPDGMTLTSAIWERHDDCIKWLIERGCPIESDTLLAAACTGRVDLMRQLRESGCPWHPCAYTDAAAEGHVECLAYMDANGFPRDATAMERAAAAGRIRVMQYLHESGLGWHPDTCTSALGGPLALECLAYACERGCSMDLDRCMRLAVKCGDARCIAYLTRLDRRRQGQTRCEAPM
nr:ankyrin repeat [Pandoravirus massiliensis]